MILGMETPLFVPGGKTNSTETYGDSCADSSPQP